MTDNPIERLSELTPTDLQAAADAVQFVCDNKGLRKGTVGAKLPVIVYPYLCPFCDGAGKWSDGERCQHCYGYGLTDDTAGWPKEQLRRAPRPPAVMARPCTDCAYRPGSPEDGSPVRPDASTPFFCHHGLTRVGDGYVATAMLADQIPLGAMLCAGWWALATGEPLPERAFRDPGGSDRTPDAPTPGAPGE